MGSDYQKEENVMPAEKSKKDSKPKKDNKPKKLPDKEMDKVAGGSQSTPPPPPSSDGAT
jgi:hypothetical protein